MKWHLAETLWSVPISPAPEGASPVYPSSPAPVWLWARTGKKKKKKPFPAARPPTHPQHVLLGLLCSSQHRGHRFVFLFGSISCSSVGFNFTLPLLLEETLQIYLFIDYSDSDTSFLLPRLVPSTKWVKCGALWKRAFSKKKTSRGRSNMFVAEVSKKHMNVTFMEWMIILITHVSIFSKPSPSPSSVLQPVLLMNSNNEPR